MSRLEEAATANFVTHASWASSTLPPSRDVRVETGPELTLVDSGLASDTFNVVCAARLPPEDVDEEARRVRDHFASVERPFSWWVAPGDEPRDLATRLERLGLGGEESELAMSASLDGFSAAKWTDGVAGLRIERVATPDRLALFARINAENWDPPDTIVEGYYRRGAQDLLGEASPQRFSVAFVDGQPAAAVEVTLAADVAGVYNLSTRAAYRRRGIGAALLAAVLEDARKEGYGTAVLQATGAGAGLYRRLGFGEFGVITEHKPGNP